MYKLRLGKSVDAWSDTYYDLIGEAKFLGFDSVDFDITSRGYIVRTNDRIEMKNRFYAIGETGLQLNGIHLPYGTESDISSADKSARYKAISDILNLCDFAAEYRPTCYILHGSFEPIMDNERSNRLENMIESMKVILQHAPNVVLENLPRTCLLNTSDEMLYVKEKLPQLKFCLDTNHFLREYTYEAIDKIGKNILTTHISDYDFVFEKHLIPGHWEGKLDWNMIIRKLEEARYSGVFNYELNVPLKEVKENYEKLFEAYNEKT